MARKLLKQNSGFLYIFLIFKLNSLKDLKLETGKDSNVINAILIYARNVPTLKYRKIKILIKFRIINNINNTTINNSTTIRISIMIKIVEEFEIKKKNLINNYHFINILYQYIK